jgi:hypothetical protein
MDKGNILNCVMEKMYSQVYSKTMNLFMERKQIYKRKPSIKDISKTLNTLDLSHRPQKQIHIQLIRSNSHTSLRPQLPFIRPKANQKKHH